MILKCKRVRRAPTTGQGKNRRIRGVVYLNRTWFGQTVTVVTHNDYVDFKRRLRHAETIIRKFRKDCHEHLSS